jgi:uncharacterized membrane protein YphA (DoxX/SURF4 family)
MAISKSNITNYIRDILSIVACLIIGIILLIAGTGKLFGFGQMPGQTEFLDRFIPDFLMTPEFARFIGMIFIPYLLPIIEIVIAIFLLAGIWPRVMAIIVVPLTVGFMANNLWTIGQGMDKFPDCPCFGIWETWTGVRFTPTQSLYIDIGLFVLAVLIVFLHPGGFFSHQFWFTGRKKISNSVNKL